MTIDKKVELLERAVRALAKAADAARCGRNDVEWDAVNQAKAVISELDKAVISELDEKHDTLPLTYCGK